MQLHHHPPPPPPPDGGPDGPPPPPPPHHHHDDPAPADDGTPEKGCTAVDAGNINCNWTQMATATCPVAGPGVIMPDNCRPQRILILI